MTPLELVRERAEAAGHEEAICASCGLFTEGEGSMGTCRRRRETQLRYGICLSWTTSTIAPAPVAAVVEPDGTKRLFPGAVEPSEGDRPPGEAHGLKCAEPGCDGLLELRWSYKLSAWFYGCARYPDCNGTLPANEDGSPRGKPRTKELQGWRNRAHQAFDELWKSGACSRGDAYSWLRAAIGLGHKEAHMMQMTAEQCQAVIRFVDEKGPGTEFWGTWKQERAERKREKQRARRRKGGRAGRRGAPADRQG